MTRGLRRRIAVMLPLSIALVVASLLSSGGISSASAATSQHQDAITSRSYAVLGSSRNPTALGDRTAFAVIPQITSQACTSNRSSWVHVYSVSVGTFCLGFKGTWTFNNGNGRQIYRLTFGNNYGNLTFSWDGAQFYGNFDGGSQGFSNPNTAIIWQLTINGWH